MYEALTGCLPTAQPVYNGLQQSITLTPISPDQIVAAIPPEISQLILKAVARNPTRRYSSILELVSQYQKVFQNVVATSPTTEISTLELALEVIGAVPKLVDLPIPNQASHNLPTQPLTRAQSGNCPGKGIPLRA